MGSDVVAGGVARGRASEAGPGKPQAIPLSATGGEGEDAVVSEAGGQGAEPARALALADFAPPSLGLAGG